MEKGEEEGAVLERAEIVEREFWGPVERLLSTEFERGQTVGQIAQVLSVSPRTIQRWAHRRGLPHQRAGRPRKAQ